MTTKHKHAPKGPLKNPMVSSHPMPAQRCRARSKQSGTQCKQPAIRGGTVCRFHGGAAPQVQAKAEERLAALVQPAITRLEQLMMQEQFPSTAIAAVKDVLDRNMGRAKEKLDVNLSGELDIVSARLIAARKKFAERG